MMDTQNSMPLITIGITCYNAQETIGRAIASALAQDWPDFEVFVVDDCSSDVSVAAVQAAIKGCENARLIAHEVNTGPAGARQTILQEAKGDFIAFFDDDDESLPERLKIQYMRIVAYEAESGSDLVACYASGRRLYPNGYEMFMAAIGSGGRGPVGVQVADYQLFYGKKPDVFYGAGTPTCSLMARKEVFAAVGGFDPSLRRVEDVDFAIALGLKGGHFIGCPEVLYIQHASEGGDKSPEKNMESEVALAEKYADYLRTVGRYEYARRWPLVRYYHFKGQHTKMVQMLFALFLKAPVKTTQHFFTTGPRRLLHEMKMKRERRQ